MTQLLMTVSDLNPRFDYAYEGMTLHAVVQTDAGEFYTDDAVYEWTIGERVVRTEYGSYTLTRDDGDTTVTVRALLRDAQGNYTIPVQSNQSIAVHDTNAPTGGSLSIVPDVEYPTAGTLLTLDGQLDDPDGMGPLSYQWRADGQAIAGATGTSYTMTEADAGKRIDLLVSYVDGAGVANTYSTYKNLNGNNYGNIHVEGALEAGGVLHATVVDPDVALDIHYAWETADAAGDWSVVAGAATSTLALGADAPTPARVLAYYTDGRGWVETAVTTLGTDGGDVIRMSYNRENVWAGAGDDTIYHRYGLTSTDGGDGLDTYVADDGFHHTLHQDSNTPGTWYIVESLTMRGTATLTNIERVDLGIQGHFAIDIDGAAGQAYRLYQAAFDRVADKEGLGFWISRLDLGTGLHEVAEAFVASSEFRALYGATPTNDALVDLLYQHVLHRAPDAASQAWVDALDQGQVSVADVLVGFSESAENQAALVGAMQYGIAYTPYA